MDRFWTCRWFLRSVAGGLANASVTVCPFRLPCPIKIVCIMQGAFVAPSRVLVRDSGRPGKENQPWPL